LAMFALRPHEVGEIVYSCAAGGKGVLGALTVSVLMVEGWWRTLLRVFEGVSEGMESLEIIGVPEDVSENGEGSQTAAKGLLKIDKDDVDALKMVCPKLTTFEMSILRAKSMGKAKWTFEGGGWKSV